jgi:hypothetical protein
LLINELQKRAAMSAGLRELALKKTAGPVARLSGKALAALAAHPLRTGVVVLGGAAALHKGRATYASMDPAAHRVMLGMP